MLKTYLEKLKFFLRLTIARLIQWSLPAISIHQNNKYKSQFKQCGEGVLLNGKVTFVSSENVILGSNVHIGNNSYIDTRGGIEIGENSHISRNFVAHSSSHQYEGHHLPYDESYVLKSISIGRNVWIGTNVILLPGVQIGEGAIIGAGALVVKNVPPFAIVVNQPAQVIKFRNKEHYEKIDSLKSYGGVSGRPIEDKQNN